MRPVAIKCLTQMDTQTYGKFVNITAMKFHDLRKNNEREGCGEEEDVSHTEATGSDGGGADRGGIQSTLYIVKYCNVQETPSL
jgi:hypothetical protein